MLVHEVYLCTAKGRERALTFHLRFNYVQSHSDNATAPCSAHNVLPSISIHCTIGTLIFMY